MLGTLRRICTPRGVPESDQPRQEQFAIPGPVAPATKKRRWLPIVAIAVGSVLVLGAATGGYFMGQGTRMSDGEVQQRVSAQARYDSRQLKAAVQQQKADFGKDLVQAKQQAQEEGYDEGQDDGYVAGEDAGYVAGEDAGYESGSAEGYSQGFDEGTCYMPGSYIYVC